MPLTSTLSLFSTAHVTYHFHPLHFAKFGATIDFISNGRWGLNIVTGYSAAEQAAFGIEPPIGHDEAYDMADEFTTLMKYLWSEDVPIEFEGQDFHDRQSRRRNALPAIREGLLKRYLVVATKP